MNLVTGMVAPLIREIARCLSEKVSSGIDPNFNSNRDAMEVAAINPFKYLVVTRILANDSTFYL
jgi:phospholipid/cholesterol/gamma-HCH transport system permease protein